MTDIETPVETWTADDYTEARKALDTLRLLLELAQRERATADAFLVAINRPVLSDTRDYLADSISEVANELREIADAIARHEEDVG